MRATLRAICFAAGLVLILHIANTFFVKTDTLTYLALHELTHRDDVELAFVGSSVARNHFVPDIIREETGLEPFNVGIPYMSMQGNVAAAKLLFAHHQPQWTVLVAEPYLFESRRESVQTQFRLMPFIRNPLDKAAYYLDLCSQDERWLDRLLMPRLFGIESLDELIKGVHIRLDPQHYLDEQEKGLHSTYRGNGFMYPNPRAADSERMKISGYHSTAERVSALPDLTRERILCFEALCRENDSRMMIVYFPYITTTTLAEPNHLVYGDLLKDFCEERGIPFVNFVMAKETLMPTLEPYYENNDHMSIDGAEALSRAFSHAFNLHAAGERTDDLFYEDADAYLASVDRVTNVWFDAVQQPIYTAACNHGSMVTPEYSFVWIAQDGRETMARAYAPDPVWRGEIPEGSTLRVYARAALGDMTPVYRDLEGQ